MSNSILIFILATTTVFVQCHSDEIKFINDELVIGDACVSVLNSVKQNGVCKPIEKCARILASIREKNFDHTVCGYYGFKQIVCCPSSKNKNAKLQLVAKLDFDNNAECTVANTNESGVIKFLADCPAINKNNGAEEHTNKLCADEICSDLVCCPKAKATSRLKDVCWNVDHPVETIKLRLFLNQECTVNQLNIKGRYQKVCDYAERNPELKPILQNVCSNQVCDGWYCCPIEDGDERQCSANQIEGAAATIVGPKCVDSKSGLRGTCKKRNDCSHNDIQALDVCGTYCCHNFFCCPDVSSPKDQSISVRECNSYTKYLSKNVIEVPVSLNEKKCITFYPYVAGGFLTKPGDYPHMAALGFRPHQEMLWLCGGSLISDRYVLTAAHCLTNRNTGPVQKVRLGAINLLNDNNTADCPEDFNVAKLIPHPEYSPKYVYNDIGLIELAGQVQFNFHIRPICLPPNDDLTDYFISMGWGSTDTAEETSVSLLKVYQVPFTYEQCNVQYSVGRRYPNGITKDTHICAGSRSDIQSTCSGDSGGPLFIHHLNNSRLYQIYGIVSFGTACGFPDSPGVYTKVYPYLKWIEGTVWKY